MGEKKIYNNTLQINKSSPLEPPSPHIGVPTISHEEKKRQLSKQVGTDVGLVFATWVEYGKQQTKPNIAVLKKRSTIRTSIVDWIAKAAEHMSLHYSTKYVAVHYLNIVRFRCGVGFFPSRVLLITNFFCFPPSHVTIQVLSDHSIERNKLMLLGITCLYLAIKFEETDTDRPHMKYILDYAKQTQCLEATVTDRHVLEMELLIIKAMHFNLRVITPWHILESMLALYGGLTHSDFQVGD